MDHGQASRTALGAAGLRAAHQALEGGAIFADPLAAPILGADAETALAWARERPDGIFLRMFVAARSRFAEDAAQRFIERDGRQIVVLGAGLDTFAYRLPPHENLVVWEVDHPATQADKRRRLREAGIGAPAHLRYAACDFERTSFLDALWAAGFARDRPSFFLWLGVAPYLTERAVLASLADIGALPGGAEVVLDFVSRPSAVAEAGARLYLEKLAEQVAAAGEALKSFFASDELIAKLRDLGFEEMELCDWRHLAKRAALDSPLRAAPTGAGANIIRARAAPRG